MPTHLTSAQLERDLSVRDLSDPAEGAHALQVLVDAAVNALAAAWPVRIRWCRGPRIVPVEDNYDELLIDPEAASRDTRHTRYVDDRRMLRSHSSAMVPPALRHLDVSLDDDVLLVCPGVVYRRDAIDWQHTGTPHQMDLWRLTRRSQTANDLEEMIGLLAETLSPGRAWQATVSRHSYTIDGRQVDVAAEGRWVEVWECGLAHPAVLRRAGLEGWSGLALGMGLDRLLMLAKGIPDIRLLRSADPRVSSQMTNLAPYQPVSTMPPIRRDLSIAVEAGDDAETLGDRVRDALGTVSDTVEEVTVLSRTAYDDLPAVARLRLGIDAGQDNLLVRVVLRALDRTLTDAEANQLRDRIYATLHQGSSHLVS